MWISLFPVTNINCYFEFQLSQIMKTYFQLGQNLFNIVAYIMPRFESGWVCGVWYLLQFMGFPPRPSHSSCRVSRGLWPHGPCAHGRHSSVSTLSILGKIANLSQTHLLRYITRPLVSPPWFFCFAGPSLERIGAEEGCHPSLLILESPYFSMVSFISSSRLGHLQY